MASGHRSGKYTLTNLTKELALLHIDAITQLVNFIPIVDYYSPEKILSDEKDGQELFGKWEHSLVVFDGEVPVALLIAYERPADAEAGYPYNSLYINILSVKPSHRKQGIASDLLTHFLLYSSLKKFKYLTGTFMITVQTNSADWNRHVSWLYQSLGFAITGEKQYSNRTDFIFTFQPH